MKMGARILEADYNSTTEKFTLNLSGGGPKVMVGLEEARKLVPHYKGENPRVLQGALVGKRMKREKEEKEMTKHELEIKLKVDSDIKMPMQLRVQIEREVMEMMANNGWDQTIMDPSQWKEFDTSSGKICIRIEPGGDGFRYKVWDVTENRQKFIEEFQKLAEKWDSIEKVEHMKPQWL